MGIIREHLPSTWYDCLNPKDIEYRAISFRYAFALFCLIFERIGVVSEVADRSVSSLRMRWTRPVQQAFTGAGARSSGTFPSDLGVETTCSFNVQSPYRFHTYELPAYQKPHYHRMFGGCCRREALKMFPKVSYSPSQPFWDLIHLLLPPVPVSMDYDRFRPTGTAYLTLSSQTSMPRNLRTLNKASMSTLRLHATAVPNPFSTGRTRGLVGREQAANKGLINGNGPNGGTSGHGKNVIVWGLPGKLPPDGLRNYLRAFRLSDASGQESIVKIEP